MAYADDTHGKRFTFIDPNSLEFWQSFIVFKHAKEHLVICRFGVEQYLANWTCRSCLVDSICRSMFGQCDALKYVQSAKVRLALFGVPKCVRPSLEGQSAFSLANWVCPFFV